MTAIEKTFIRKMLNAKVRQIKDLNRMWEKGLRFGTDAWCGHDCVITDHDGNMIAYRDGRKVTFA